VNRTVLLALASLTAFLVLFPLTLDKPGLPAHLKADEAAYYLAAQSLAHDHDLRVEPRDVERAFAEFPFGPVNNLIVMSDDGWKTTYFGKPFLYSLAAVPFAAAFGANGLLAFNLLLTMAMVWMGYAYLRRYNPEGLAALYSAGFFLLSVGFAYAFWLQPEVLNMFGVAACLYFGLPRDVGDRPGAASAAAAPSESAGGPQRRWLLFAILSGAAILLPIYNKPMFGAIALAPLLGYLRRRDWKSLAAWVAALAVTAGAVTGLAVALTGHPTAYFGVQRIAITLCEPGVVPVPREVVPASVGVAAIHGPVKAEPPSRRTWNWLIRKPDVTLSEELENLGYFFWGRHTGFLLYTPFAALSVVLFLLWSRRSLERWALLGVVAAIGLFFLTFIAWNWQGGGGFVGNRYFVSAIPAFLFLVTEIRPRALVAVGSTLAGLFLGPLLLTPFGAVVPEPTLQAHVRGAPFRLFPLELSLRNVPGYEHVETGDLRLLGRKDLFLPRGAEMWLRGNSDVELYFQSSRPLERVVLNLGNLAPRNRVDVRFGTARERLDFKQGEETRRLDLRPGRPDQVRRTQYATAYVYRLRVHTTAGRNRPWVREYPPNSCPYFAQDKSTQENFYVGAAIAYLGNGAQLDADLYKLQWGNSVIPASVEAGKTFNAITRLWNRSGHPWEGAGTARISLSYHWLDEGGKVVVRDGLRTPLPLPIPDGGRISVQQQIAAPPQPGKYVLELDPVFESVAWFSEKNGGTTYRVPIEVRPAAPSGAPAPKNAPAGGGGSVLRKKPDAR
jgi:hypothetical protein